MHNLPIIDVKNIFGDSGGIHVIGLDSTEQGGQGGLTSCKAGPDVSMSLGLLLVHSWLQVLKKMQGVWGGGVYVANIVPCSIPGQLS